MQMETCQVQKALALNFVAARFKVKSEDVLHEIHVFFYFSVCRVYLIPMI